nr:L,D-transpeptidase family protein [uncultured Mucilaginibacter sp.]
MEAAFKIHRIIGRCKTLLAVTLTIIVFFASEQPASPASFSQLTKPKVADLQSEIQRQLNSGGIWLSFPASTKKFYAQKKYQPYWIAGKNQDKTWKAMLMLDCVLQFGLSYSDYRYNDHLPTLYHDILEKPDQVSLAKQARFEIMLTDDIITFINQLHFGVLNPAFGPGAIDSLNNTFRAESVLAYAMEKEKFMAELLSVQPKSKQYERLQRYLSDTVRYMDNCGELPEGELQQVALNMERLRWAQIDEDSYLLVNIPAYKLEYYLPDSVYNFKVIVGRPESPTPSLQSEIRSITTAPDWKVQRSVFVNVILPNALKSNDYLQSNHYSIYNKSGQYINAKGAQLAAITQHPENYYARQSAGCDNALGLMVFRFPNLYEISMHDSPDHTLFAMNERALSQSSLRIDNPLLLAKLMLNYVGDDSKINRMQKTFTSAKTQTFNLKKAIPLKIAYLTCDISNGQLVTYTDIYNLDKNLRLIMFGMGRPISMR